MHHQVGGRKFNRDIKERKKLFRKLVSSLILYERIQTTTPRAREIKAIAERLINRAKRADLPARRYLISYLGQENTVAKMMEVIAPSFKDNKSGFTRITNLPRRPGDNAPLSQLEFTTPPSEKLVTLNNKQTGKKNKEQVKTKSKKEIKT